MNAENIDIRLTWRYPKSTLRKDIENDYIQRGMMPLVHNIKMGLPQLHQYLNSQTRFTAKALKAPQDIAVGILAAQFKGTKHEGHRVR